MPCESQCGENRGAWDASGRVRDHPSGCRPYAHPRAELLQQPRPDATHGPQFLDAPEWPVLAAILDNSAREHWPDARQRVELRRPCPIEVDHDGVANRGRAVAPRGGITGGDLRRV